MKTIAVITESAFKFRIHELENENVTEPINFVHIDSLNKATEMRFDGHVTLTNKYKLIGYDEILKTVILRTDAF